MVFLFIYLFSFYTHYRMRQHFLQVAFPPFGFQQGSSMSVRFSRHGSVIMSIIRLLSWAHRGKWQLFNCFKAASRACCVVSHCAQLQCWPLVQVCAKITNVRSDWVQPATHFIWLPCTSNDVLLLQCTKQVWTSNTDDIWPVAGLMNCVWHTNFVQHLVNFSSYLDLWKTGNY